MNVKELISNNIEFLKNINDKELLGLELSKSISETIEDIEKYGKNQEVKLAILGEFSSGKSTLINALLKKDILSHSNIPTTAVNTYLRYGDKDQIFVWLKDGKRKITEQEISKYVKEGSINDEVERVELIRNNKILKNNLVMIDTPGINSGIDNHNIQWNDAIKESNAAIFVISAQRLTSRTFTDFLNENKENLGKFIFVINKCDSIDDEIDSDIGDSIKNAVKYVEDAIEKEAGIITNKIYAISAMGELLNNTQIDDLKNNFVELEKKLYLMMETDKELIVMFKILDIQKRIFNKISNVTGDRKKLFNIKLNELKGEEVDINKYKEELIQKIEVDLINNINEFQREYYKYHNSVFEDCEATIKQEIYSVDSVSKLKREGPVISSNNVKKAQTNVVDYIINKRKNLQEQYIEDIRISFQEYFSLLQEMYKDLKVKRKIDSGLIMGMIFFGIAVLAVGYYNTQNIIISIIASCIGVSLVYYANSKNDPYEFEVKSYNFESHTHPNESYNSALLESASDGSEASAMGLGGGALIGAAVGGPVGAIIGGAIGGFLGSLTGTRLNDLKNDYYDQTLQKLRYASEKLRQQNVYKIDEMDKDIIIRLKIYINQIIEQYDALLTKIMESQSSKKSELERINNNLIKIGEESVKKISILEEKIKEIKTQLQK